MPAACVIVCERQGEWAAALHRSLRGLPLELWQVRSPAECAEVLEEAPASVVALELDELGLDETLALLAEVSRRWPAAVSVVFAAREYQAYQWLVRESGALHFVTSPRRLPELAGLLRRHLAATPPARRTLRQEMWDRLPWKDVRSDAA